MKIWKSFSGEHSAKLKIVGTFKNAADAQKTADMFNDLLAVQNKYPNAQQKAKGLTFSDEMLDFAKKYSFMINPNDIESLDYFSDVQAEGEKIIYQMDDFAIQPLVQAMVENGAKVEVFSRHDYDD